MKKVLAGFMLLSAVVACKKENKEAATDEPMATEQTAEVKDTIAYADFGMDTSDLPKGLNVGDMAPQINMTTADKKNIALQDLYKDQPVVVLFYRAYWCPVCVRHLDEFAQKAKEIEAKGAKLVIITPETYDNVAKTKEETKTDFMTISDVDGSIMKAFDVDFKVTDSYQEMIKEKLNASVAETNATGEAVLPVPATFIIDKGGKIVYKHFNPNYKERATVEEIVANLP
ncbi:peroxiredoxin-like family protein [Flavobacterium alkalisoli]|uniref:peroxiredoxin-like family protein n=1 Tax=Flavobacterium alkalisoli TaxID=2602769 RepID=UPI003A951238